MAKLYQISRGSKLPFIKINYGGELIQFNLVKEVSIDEDEINKQVTTQPTKYAFLAMLHKRLINEAKVLDRERKKIWAQRFIFHLTSEKAPFFKRNHHHPNQKVAESLAESDDLYQMALDKMHKTERERDDIASCVEAFEQRASLLQTLSSNIRKEKQL